jgi:hypothetical protein
MFLHWVRDDYSFVEDEIYSGQARSAFMNGGEIPNKNGDTLQRVDGTDFTSAGMEAWAANANCPSSVGVGMRKQGLDNYPEVVAANSGWCNL